MQIFGFPTSPFVRKVMLIAQEKGVDYEVVPATPHKPTPGFLAASPFRMMPAIQDGDYQLSDSTAIFHYMEALKPSPSLLPAEPQARGRAVWFEEFSDTILSGPVRTIAFNTMIGPEMLGLPGDEQAVAQAKEQIAPALDYLEQAVPQSGWLCGDYSLADASIATMIATLHYGWRPLGPRSQAWYDRVYERPAFREVRSQEKVLVDELIAARSGA